MIIISDVQTYASKEALYIAVRNAEDRVIDDAMLRSLPYTVPSYIHHHEWEVRTRSLQRFLQEINKFRKPLKILDIGCGNGWLSARLFNEGHIVTAVDLNLTELEQAERVFGTHERLRWVYADILIDEIIKAPQDVIVFSASCQYFPDIKLLIEKVKSLLDKNGSVHLLDSFFYPDHEISTARERTLQYYSQLGFPGMASHYFHHKISDLKKLGFKRRFPTFFTGKNNPQWWVV
jgi:ubiquinone/menaquinone biosynthesis C-methylase UbiE